MSDIFENFDQYISTNKEVLSVLPVNTKKNVTKYLETVDNLLQDAKKINKDIFNAINERYEKIIDIVENSKISELSKNIESIRDVEVFNELNTSYEKLGFDKINNCLDCFSEGNLDTVNVNIKLFLQKFEDFGIVLSEDDFNYSQYTNEYMKVFLRETVDGNLNSAKLKEKFDAIYWKCPDIVSHIELNLRYLYNANSKKIEKILKDRNESILKSMSLDKNGLVKRYFELNEELINLKKIDSSNILEKFVSGEWKSKDFSEKEMLALYTKLCSINYYSASTERQIEIDKTFGNLLYTLQEYKTYKKYKYIIDDLKERCKKKDSFKEEHDNKIKEIHKKEQELLKENENHKKLLKRKSNPLFIFFKKKLERKIYEFPVASNSLIMEIHKLYKELDNSEVNLRIAEFVDDSCTIKYMFKIAISFYTYAYNLVKEHYKNDPDVDIVEELQELIDFINQPYKVMLNNINLVEEPKITSIISNKYKVLNISIEPEDLEDNLETLLEDVERIVNNNNIARSGLKMSDIEFIETVKPLIMKKE